MTRFQTVQTLFVAITSPQGLLVWCCSVHSTCDSSCQKWNPFGSIWLCKHSLLPLQAPRVYRCDAVVFTPHVIPHVKNETHWGPFDFANTICCHYKTSGCDAAVFALHVIPHVPNETYWGQLTLQKTSKASRVCCCDSGCHEKCTLCIHCQGV